MNNGEFIDFMHLCEKLKNATRHSWTSEGRPESVAEHSWRLAVMAMLLCMEGEFQEVDSNKLIKMCLLHDIGEAVTGDIPSFLKTKEDSMAEDAVVERLLSSLPCPQNKKLKELFLEMNQKISTEAKLYKALDKLEAVIQHNEAPIETWLPLEHSLNQTYGYEESAVHPRIREIRDLCVEDTQIKLKKAFNTP